MKRSVVFYILIISLVSLFFMASCTTSSSTDKTLPVSYKIFTGIVRYPGNLYFPSRVRLEITLHEHNMFDGSVSFVVSQTINNPQRFPINYTLRYLSEEINPSNLFSLSFALYREGDADPYLFAESAKVKESELNIPIENTLRPY